MWISAVEKELRRSIRSGRGTQKNQRDDQPCQIHLDAISLVAPEQAHRGTIGEDVPEHVLGHHHVEVRRVLDDLRAGWIRAMLSGRATPPGSKCAERVVAAAPPAPPPPPQPPQPPPPTPPPTTKTTDLHAGVIDVHVLDRHLRVLRRHLARHDPPQPGGVEHVGLVNHRQPLVPADRRRTKEKVAQPRRQRRHRARAVDTQDKGSVLAAKAVETRGKGGILKTNAVGTQYKDAV